MQAGLRAQKNAGRFEGPEECRKICRLTRMQKSLRAHENEGKFGDLEECRKF